MAHAVSLLLVVTAAVVAYLNAGGGALVFDAKVIVGENPAVQTWSAESVRYLFTHDYWQPMATDGLYRPLTTLSFLFDRGVLGHGDAAFGYVVENVALHAICAMLVYALVWQAARRRWAATVAALLFAVHPITTEAVTNVVGRADLLAAAVCSAGCSAGCAAGIRARAGGSGRSGSPPRRRSRSSARRAARARRRRRAVGRRLPAAGGRRLRAEHAVVGGRFWSRTWRRAGGSIGSACRPGHRAGRQPARRSAVPGGPADGARRARPRGRAPPLAGDVERRLLVSPDPGRRSRCERRLGIVGLVGLALAVWALWRGARRRPAIFFLGGSPSSPSCRPRTCCG
jgi:hypothetical protein